MAVEAVTPRYPLGVSRSNSQLRRIRDVADSGIPCLTNAARIFLRADVDLGSARVQVALKSSGETLSKNSLNFSTSSSRTAVDGSSSFSSGISKPASARTASST